MKFPKHDPKIKEKVYTYVEKLLETPTLLLIEVIGRRKKRTSDQNGYLWGCIYPIFLHSSINEGWDFSNVDQVHEFCKASFAKDEVVNVNTGEIISFSKSTSTMETVEFFTYCDLIRYHVRDFFGVHIPDPDPQWREENRIIHLDKPE